MTTGRSGASDRAARRLETAFTLDCERFRALFLATFGILPVLARPIPRCQLAGRVAIAPMSSSEAPTPCWIALLDGHLGIAIADCLALTTLARPDNELFWSSRGAPWAVTW